MDYSEILASSRRNGNAGDAFGGRRKRREECKWQVADRIAKLGAVRAVPGIDGIEVLQLRNAGILDHADQIESGVGDGAGAVGEAD